MAQKFVVVVAVALFLLGLFSFFKGMHDCSNRGGEYVKTLWGTYKCIEPAPRNFVEGVDIRPLAG